jgi:PKD repeat protein
VSGSHAYASTGTYTVKTTVSDAGSQAVATCKVLAFAFPSAGGAFVIGDTNSGNGAQVTFWGPQWWKLNSFSGGSGPASFKGFADSPSAPRCGATWSGRPGDSVAPPSGPPPADMAVIVSSHPTKSGSVVSGDVAHIVVVKTGRSSGTGTVEAQVC